MTVTEEGPREGNYFVNAENRSTDTAIYNPLISKNKFRSLIIACMEADFCKHPLGFQLVLPLSPESDPRVFHTFALLVPQKFNKV